MLQEQQQSSHIIPFKPLSLYCFEATEPHLHGHLGGVLTFCIYNLAFFQRASLLYKLQAPQLDLPCLPLQTSFAHLAAFSLTHVLA